MGIIQLRQADFAAIQPLDADWMAHPRPRPLAAPSRLTRRRLLWTAGGAVAAGAALAAGLPARSAYGQGIPQPSPIPGGSPGIADMAGGQLFHVFGPGPEGAGIDPLDAEPSTITDFMGSVGLAYLNGTVVRTNTVTGEVRKLPFISSDMRFMKGRFRGTDGQIHEGAFVFV